MNCKLRRLDLLRSGQMSDCELHVTYTDECKNMRCSRKFRCHKIILVSASEEFESLINGPEFEKGNRILLVDDASPDAYEALLLYIYTYEICNAITLDMCSELLHLANKYKIFDFIDCYIQKLANQDWPMEVVLQIFQLANEQNNPKIMDLVSQKILPVASQVLNDNSFLKLNVQELKALMTILKSKEAIPDKDLLRALKKYQRCNCINYNDMETFQQFVEVAHLFGEVLFEVDGTLALEKEPESNVETEPESEPNTSDEPKKKSKSKKKEKQSPQETEHSTNEE